MAITTAERMEIEKLLVLMFNAAPGATYLSQVVSIYETLGHNLQQLANNLDDISAFNSLHPNFQTAAEFAADFLTPLGLQNDAAAKSFVIDKFNAGVAKGEIMYEGLLALESVGSGAAAQYVAAKAILENKAEVAEYYSVTKGVAQTDINTLILVLNGITADHATVVTAESEIDSGTRGTSGITVSLTPSQDTVVGTASSDTVNGLFGDATVANNTFTAGDSVDGAAGSDRLNLVALGTTASQAITVKNVEAINIQDTVGATFNALLAENSPGISFTNTVAGKVSMVTSASTGSTFGLAGKGDLTVDFSSTSGTADTANLSLAGVGTSTTVRSTVNVADGNTVEKVTIAATGSNFVTLTGGTVAASLVITGAGTNNFKLDAADSLAAVATIDASASTGANTFGLGGNLNTGTTIKGGTGADTVSTTLSSATLVAPNMTGVETLTTSFVAPAVVDLAGAVGLTAVSASVASPTAATPIAVKFQNAPATVATVTVSSVNANGVDSPVTFGYGSATKGDLTLKLGSATAGVDLGAVTLSNSTGTSITTVGALASDIDVLKIGGSQTAVSFTAVAGSSLTTAGASVTGAIGALNVTVGAGALYSGYVDVTSAGKSIGDVTLTATGNKAEIGMDKIRTTAGDIGNISLSVTGDDFSGSIGAEASGGSVGNVSITVTGDDADLQYFVSAGYVSGSSDAGEVGNVGNVTISVNGDDNYLSGAVDAIHGDMGNVNISVTGDNNEVYFSGSAEHLYYWDGAAYYEVGGGNVGTVTISIDGESSGYVSLLASGGAVGDVAIATNNGGDLTLYIETGMANWYSGAPANAGDIGNVTVQIGQDSNLNAYLSADGGDIGNVSVTVNGSDGSGYMALTAMNASGSDDGTLDSDDYNRGGNIGNITLSIDGDDAHFELDAYASGGVIGTTNVSVNGTDASGYVRLNSTFHSSGSPGGDVGATNITIGDAAGFDLYYDITGTMGAITITGGDGARTAITGAGGDAPGTANDGGAAVTSTTLSFGDDATVTSAISNFMGATGATKATFEDDATDSWTFTTITGTVGAMSLTYGTGATTAITYNGVSSSVGAVTYTAGAGADVTVTQMGTVGSMGKVTLVGGDSGSSATVNETGTVASAGGVDASTWLGDTTINLSGVALGTTIRVGAAGSSVTGTENADNVFLGAGVDTVHFDATPTATDVIFTFTVGATKDVLDVPYAATTLLAVNSTNAADTVDAGEVARLVDIAAGQDITTAAGLATALETGEFAAVEVAAASNVTIITAASATASTFYVFNVTNDATAGITAAEVQLIGVVNATAASAIANLVIGNFA